MRTSFHSSPSGAGTTRAEGRTDGRAEGLAATDVPEPLIGTLLSNARGLSDAQVKNITVYQREKGLRFGEAAVALKLASDDDVLWALSQQFHYPYPLQGRRGRSAELVVAADPFSPQAEVFRDLCSQVTLAATPDVRDLRRTRHALSVLSPHVGDGKSFLAANLAVALSQVGGRTLLVDADMRTPRQHDIFGVDHDVGLSAALSGRTGANFIQSVPDLPSLFVMPVGTVPPNPMELLQRPAFALLMQELLGKFDHVVVDTPAFSRGADARVIAHRCGSALMVGRKGTTPLSAMSKMIAAVSTGQTRLMGVVMNER